MELKAHLKNLRISSRKVRLVADLVREMEVGEAKSQLKFINKKPAELLLKLICSAIANAKNNFNLDEDSLRIVKVMVNDGRILKRWRSKAMGRSARINKRTSNITVVLEGKEKKSRKEKAVKKEINKNKSENKSTK